MSEPIAIIETAGGLSGGCDNTSKLQEPSEVPHDISKKVPLHGFNVDQSYQPEANHHGTTNATKSYPLQDSIAQFNSSSFNIKPIENDSNDPHQFLLSETVHDSLRTAGLPKENPRRSSTTSHVDRMCDDLSTIAVDDIETLPTHTATGLAQRKGSTSIRLGAARLGDKVKQMARKLRSTDLHSYLTFIRTLVPRMIPHTSEIIHELSAW